MAGPVHYGGKNCPRHGDVILTFVPITVTCGTSRSFKDAFREGIRECGAGAVAAGGRIRPVPGRLGHHACRYYGRRVRCSLDWDRRRRATPVQTASQEAWLLSCAGDVSPLARAAVGRRQASVPPRKPPANGGGQEIRARAAPAGAETRPASVGVPLPFASAAEGKKRRRGPAVRSRGEILKRSI